MSSAPVTFLYVTIPPKLPYWGFHTLSTGDQVWDVTWPRGSGIREGEACALLPGYRDFWQHSLTGAALFFLFDARLSHLCCAVLPTRVFDLSIYTSFPPPADILFENQKRAGAAKDDVCDHATHLDLPAGVESRAGDPRETITWFVNISGAELLEVGSRGLSSASTMLMGSVSSYLASHEAAQSQAVRDGQWAIHASRLTHS